MMVGHLRDATISDDYYLAIAHLDTLDVPAGVFQRCRTKGMADRLRLGRESSREMWNSKMGQ